jgi:hypothetical protein
LSGIVVSGEEETLPPGVGGTGAGAFCNKCMRFVALAIKHRAVICDALGALSVPAPEVVLLLRLEVVE